MEEQSSKPQDKCWIRRIEKTGKEDFESIASISNAYIKMGLATLDTAFKTGSYYEALVKNMHEREGIWVIENEQEIFGWGIIKRYSERVGYRFACETSVFLKQNYIGQGFGSMIKKRLIAQCKAWDYHHMVAKILKDNTTSIAYNKRLGYEKVGIQKEIGFVNGKWVDVVIMQLVLR